MCLSVCHSSPPAIVMKFHRHIHTLNILDITWEGNYKIKFLQNLSPKPKILMKKKSRTRVIFSNTLSCNFYSTLLAKSVKIHKIGML